MTVRPATIEQWDKELHSGTSSGMVSVTARVNDLVAWQSLPGIRHGVTIPHKNEWNVTADVPIDALKELRTATFVKSLRVGENVMPEMLEARSAPNSPAITRRVGDTALISASTTTTTNLGRVSVTTRDSRNFDPEFALAMVQSQQDQEESSMFACSGCEMPETSTTTTTTTTTTTISEPSFGEPKKEEESAEKTSPYGKA